MFTKSTFLITAGVLLAVGSAGNAGASEMQTTDNESVQKPFSFEASYVGDAYYNAAGGLRTGGGFMGMGNIRVGFDTQRAGLWKGGQFFINGASIHGKSLTDNYLGDIQVASNIDAGEHNYLHELWFRQTLGPVTITAGLQDLNAEFMVTEGGGEFINSSFGTPSTIALEVPVPIFPLTGLGVSARWDISDRWAIQGAIFDGRQTDFDRNPHNVHWKFGHGEGILAMGEIHLDGRYKIGAYTHSGTRTWGLHGSVDQPINDRVGMFAQIVVTPKSKATNNYYVGLGANLAGVFGDRDSAGLAMAHAGMHKAGERHETTVELYYRYNFSENFSLQPDIQWIVNPAGSEYKLRNAVVGILRMNLTF